MCVVHRLLGDLRNGHTDADDERNDPYREGISVLCFTRTLSVADGTRGPHFVEGCDGEDREEGILIVKMCLVHRYRVRARVRV